MEEQSKVDLQEVISTAYLSKVPLGKDRLSVDRAYTPYIKPELTVIRDSEESQLLAGAVFKCVDLEFKEFSTR
ncbi:hypothetical protein V1478_006771 [Vespula squamosa]|uniref:Uncharacterized protein n=1 Tax=Vespula squamosa TaxID=30214 RepID=A0ABD2B0V7_VESSQ